MPQEQPDHDLDDQSAAPGERADDVQAAHQQEAAEVVDAFNPDDAARQGRMHEREGALRAEFEEQMRTGSLDDALATLYKRGVVNDVLGRGAEALDKPKEFLFFNLMNAQRFEDGLRMAGTVGDAATRERLTRFVQRSIDTGVRQRVFEAVFADEREEFARLSVDGTAGQLKELRDRLKAKLDAEQATIDDPSGDALNALVGASGINEVDAAVRAAERAERAAA